MKCSKARQIVELLLQRSAVKCKRMQVLNDFETEADDADEEAMVKKRIDLLRYEWV